ncbi:hypothetical protein BpHYR1_033070 [Brachionus plicatilis]|uniref:Uncharacterized protein n=1 Tax=Brachionus plicatilis TaxID=10195 RepID=A0A3M7RI80_BRAPC|nr:hypothetical protein BpHYR1_033070 [Brachionus plicatilis]
MSQASVSVLYQYDENRNENVKAYKSRNLKPAELDWNVWQVGRPPQLLLLMDVVFCQQKICFLHPKKRLSQPKQVKMRGRPRKVNKDEDELVEDVIDVETEVAKENKRGRSKKMKTALEKEKPKKKGRHPKSKK